MSNSPQDTTEYKIYVDWIRAAAILLGIPFHVGLIYAVGNEWFITSESKSYAITMVTGVLSSTRMPLFFMMAGMLTALILTRKSLAAWFKSRLLRLCVPLITATLVLSPFVMIVMALQAVDAGQSGSVGTAFRDLLQTGGNQWVGHLWFLYVLIGYSLLVSVSFGILERLQTTVSRRFCDDGTLQVSALLKLAGLVAAYAIAVEAVFHFALPSGSRIAEIISLIKLEPFFEFLPYFVIGMVLYGVKLPAVYRDTPVLVTTVLAVGCYAVVWNSPDIIMKAARYLSGGVSAVLLSAVIVSYGQRVWTAKNPHVQSIVDASFTIYLVHYPICVAIGYMMTRADVPVWLGYSGNIIMTFGLSLFIHRVVSRSEVALFLLNGVKPRWLSPSRQHG